MATQLNKIITFKSKEQKKKLTIQAVNKDMNLKEYLEHIHELVADRKIKV